MKMRLIGSYVWMLGPKDSGTFGEELGGVACWRGCISEDGLWGFKSPHLSVSICHSLPATCESGCSTRSQLLFQLHACLLPTMVTRKQSSKIVGKSPTKCFSLEELPWAWCLFTAINSMKACHWIPKYGMEWILTYALNLNLQLKQNQVITDNITARWASACSHKQTSVYSWGFEAGKMFDFGALRCQGVIKVLFTQRYNLSFLSIWNYLEICLNSFNLFRLAYFVPLSQSPSEN